MSLININFIISALVIIAVFVMQYVFNMTPCDMCLIERYPYYLLIIIGLASIIFKFEKRATIKKIANYASILILLFGFLYTLRHVLVERNLVNLNSGCTSNLSDLSDKSKLLESLNQTPLIRCDEPTYLFNFISVAEANLIMTFLLLCIILFFEGSINLNNELPITDGCSKISFCM